MNHKRGGWRRVIYFHSNINTSCPGSLVAESVSSNRTYCKKVQDPNRFNLDYEYFTWNDDQSISFSEVRGYVTVKVKGNYSLDGWSDNAQLFYENGNADGVHVLVRQIGTPFPDRPFFHMWLLRLLMKQVSSKWRRYSNSCYANISRWILRL